MFSLCSNQNKLPSKLPNSQTTKSKSPSWSKSPDSAQTVRPISSINIIGSNSSSASPFSITTFPTNSSAGGRIPISATIISVKPSSSKSTMWVLTGAMKPWSNTCSIHSFSSQIVLVIVPSRGCVANISSTPLPSRSANLMLAVVTPSGSGKYSIVERPSLHDSSFGGETQPEKHTPKNISVMRIGYSRMVTAG